MNKIGESSDVGRLTFFFHDRLRARAVAILGTKINKIMQSTFGSSFFSKGRYLLLISLWAVTACQPRHSVTESSRTVPPSEKLRLALKSPEKIVFSQVKEMVFDGSCIECHGPDLRRDNVDLTSMESLISGEQFRQVLSPFSPAESSIYKSLVVAAGRRHMPPLNRSDLQLSQSQIDLVFLWIENGAKEEVDQVIEKPATIRAQLQSFFDHPDTIDHATIQKFIFQDNCFKCHSKSGDNVDRDVLRYSANVTSYRSLFSRSATVIEKGFPGESSLYKAVAISQSMPPQNEGFDILNGYRIQLLRLWILNCAIENFADHEGEELSIDPDLPDKVRLCEGQ